MSVFDMLNSNKYWTKQLKTEQHNKRQNNTWQNFIVLNNIWSYMIFGRQKAIEVF